MVHCSYLGVLSFIVFTISRWGREKIFCLKTFLTFTNSVDHDEMQRNAAFHLGLHCLQQYSFTGFLNTKV